MNERWGDVPGWSDRYQVSDLGRVRSKTIILIRSNGTKYTIRSRILKQTIDGQGRASVRLHSGSRGKTYRVHQLVMLVFVGPPSEGRVVCHGVNGIYDNSLQNLRYDTRSNNNLDCYRDGTMLDARPVRRSDGKEYPSLHSAAREIGVHVTSICDALKGRSKTCAGFTWEYVQ